MLKPPDSGFGLDVLKFESEEDLRREADRFFRISALIVAQEWLPTGFHWRVGVYDKRPLFVAKYFMALGQWKVNQVVEGQRQRAWRMPAWEQYQEALKSNFADLPNIVPHAPDAIIAACFLSRFTGRVPWVHLDIGAPEPCHMTS